MNSKILVIRFSSLGDVTLASAPVLSLKIGFPKSRIHFLTRESYVSIARLMPGVDEVVSMSESPSVRELLGIIKRLDSQEYDIILDLQGNFRSYLIRQLVFAGQKMVYNKGRSVRRRIVNYKDFSTKAEHTIDKYNDCVSRLGTVPAAKRPILRVNSLHETKSTGRQIFFAPGASFPNKQWPIDRFVEVATELQRSHQARIVWATTSHHRDNPCLNDKIHSENLTHLTDCPLDKLTEIIHQSDLCIANDSGIAHLASAVGTPVIAVFGPTHPALGFAPRGLYDKVIEVDEYCRPCSLHGDKLCFREERFCFTRIGPALIVSEAERILERREHATKAVFVDRDGTIIVDKPFDSNPDNMEFETGSIEALHLAQKLGLKIIIVSNQSGVARGYFNITDAERFNQVLVLLLAQKGIKVDAIYFCPHYSKGKVAPYSRICSCRKPSPGMVEKAALELNLDVRQSYVIGDKLDDFNLGSVVGARSFLVRNGQGLDYEDTLRVQVETAEIRICQNLLDAMNKIEGLEKTKISRRPRGVASKIS